MRQRRNPAVLQRTVAGSHVLYHPEADAVHVLDPVGSIVWDHLTEPVDELQLIALLADAFGESPTVIERDVRRLVDELRAADLVQAVTGESSPDTRG